MAATDSYTDKLTHQHFFPWQPLLWVGPLQPSEAESEELWDIYEDNRNKPSNDQAIGSLEAFIKNHPNSPWVPSLQANVAMYYRQNGYFTSALNNWQLAWDATKRLTDLNGKRVADFTLVNWLQLLSSLGRTEKMKEIFDETKNRKLTFPYESDYRQSQEAYGIMLKHPEFSYRCGTYALNAVAQVLCGKTFFKQIWEQPSPQTGFSMADLVSLANSNHLNMLAVERPSGQKLVVPSVVHWKQNHYAAIIAQKGDSYKVLDPTFRMSRWIKADVINTECSGQFLVSASQVPAGWRILNQAETAHIFGKGFPDFWDPPPCGSGSSCPTCGGPGSLGNNGGNNGGNNNNQCSTCSQNGPPITASPSALVGMPNWTVMEPWCDLWINDEPLSYQPAKGPRIALHLFYCVNGIVYWPYYVYGHMSTIGSIWSCSWFSYIVPPNGGSDFSDGATVFTSGGTRTYTTLDGSVPDFSTNTRMLTETNSSGETIGFSLLYPSGAEDIYTNAWIDGGVGSIPVYFISKQQSANGQATTFVYSNLDDGNIVLQYVIDGDGKTNCLYYTNSNDDTELTGVVDPFGHTVSLAYDNDNPNGSYDLLTNIVDEAGISSSFIYDSSASWVIDQMVTPYGTTSFDTYYYSVLDAYQYQIVTEPNGSHQMFIFEGEQDGYPWDPPAMTSVVPPVYTNTKYVPTNRPDDGALGGSNTLDNPDWDIPGTNDYMNFANSFYWNSQQFSELSTNFLSTYANWDPTQLTTNDILLARLRHWNQGADESLMNNLSMERDPSPDRGITPGEMTWYDYPGKPDYNIEGTADTPICIIKVLPDGTEKYQINQLDQWNNITNMITTYSANGNVLTRTNSYIYAANGQDLLMSLRADRITNAAYGYDSSHQVLFMTNALGEVTRYIYNSTEQLVSITRPNGQIVTNLYDPDGHLSQQIVVGISTNVYTWTNDLVYTHTDELGLTVTNSWDPLNRLTNVAYPDGTSVAYIYSNLDLVKMVDRLGNPTTYTYDSIREKTLQTDALGHSIGYSYCDCGALDAVTDALENVTYFVHDNQGNLLQTIYPDGYSVTNTWNLIRQLVTRTDSSGAVLNNWYNNQGLLVVSSNNVGLVRGLAYDIQDRLTNTIDANHVSVGMTYDNLDRLRNRSYPDNGVESYGYTTDISGPTSYTNQISDVWLYAYDGIARKTNEICVGITTNAFAYDGAGDLLTLTDGNDHPTRWGYDQYGRVTNKLDATGTSIFAYQYDDDNRLTNRWTPAKGHTIYAYDAVGNLTNVVYTISPKISLAYDADNRLTSMVDGIGTTAYNYDQVGQLLSEGGLWPDDTVNHTYNNRLRMETSLARPGGSTWEEDYQYDTDRRLTNVTSAAGSFGYFYDPLKMQRVDELTLPGGAYIFDSYDSVARLLSTALINSGSTNLDSESYVYNTAGQRVTETNTAGDYRNYAYDNKGELTSALGYESNSSPRYIDWRVYNYDAAGNMLLWHNLHGIGLQNYGYNGLNEITNTTMGSGGTAAIPVSGSTTVPATGVTVNGASATTYGDSSFYANESVTNGLNTFTAIATDSSGDWSTNSSTVNVILTNNAYSYDTNGNMLSDGFRDFGYDDENELISACVPNVWSNSFAYDGKMRRRIEQDYTWSSATWVKTNEIHFVYDGNVVIEERNANNTPLMAYTRGNDLSGTMQGAGGIGGLLARTHNGEEVPGSILTNAFYHADGNGNITCLIFQNHQVAAKYLYDPFGNMLAMSGPLAGANKYRFSSKEWNDNAGLYYYLYRFYDPNLQRWPNRDPLAEFGFDLLLLRQAGTPGEAPTLHVGNGPNPFLFVNNSPVFSFDVWGLDNATCAGCWQQYQERVNNIAELELACLDGVIAQCLGKKGSKGSKCVAIGSGICGGITIGLETAAAAQLAGCLSGCQPTTCPAPPPPPQPIPCSTCNQNNPAPPFP